MRRCPSASKEDDIFSDIENESVTADNPLEEVPTTGSSFDGFPISESLNSALAPSASHDSSAVLAFAADTNTSQAKASICRDIEGRG